MKPVSEYLKTGIDKPAEKPEQKPVIDTKIATQLFVQINNNWPGTIDRWWPSPELKQAAKVKWALAIQPYDSETLTEALRAAEREFIKWPPTLPEIVSLLKMAQKRKQIEQPRLPRKRKEYELVKPHIDKLREIVK